MDYNKLNGSILNKSFCNKNFQIQVTFDQTQKFHTEEKLGKCEDCDKSFTRRGDVTRHMLVHNDKNDFQC